MSKFNFKDEKSDFPFYNGKPLLSNIQWLILLLSIIVMTCLPFIPLPLDQNEASILFCLIMLIPVIIVSHNNLNVLFKKIKGRDLILIVICVILYFAYCTIMNYILTQTGAVVNYNTSISQNMDLIGWIDLLIQLLGEELYRIILLILTMFLVYHFTSNRKLSIICGVILSLTVFGLIHYNSYNGAFLQMILMIGFGSFFYTLAYLISKNVIVSYIAHVLIDSVPIVLMMILGSSGIDPSQVTSFILMLI